LVNVLVSYGYLEKIGGRNIEISKEGRNKAEL
jgi:hypothetical protein